TDHITWDYVQQKLHNSFLLSPAFDKTAHLLGIQLADIYIHAIARFSNIYHSQSNKHGDKRRHLEINHEFGAYPAHFFDIFHPSDSKHNTTENQRGDNHFDQFDKAVTKGFQRYA